MYYTLFEGVPYQGKENVAGVYYKSLLPHLHSMPGFREDASSFAMHVPRQGVNIARFDDLQSIKNWREEEHHLRMQGKGTDVYESYRIRIGKEVHEDEASDQSVARQHLTLLYCDDARDGKPLDDVTSLLEEGASAKLKPQMLESTVYQGEQIVWMSVWQSTEAIKSFEQSIKSSVNGRLVQLQILRDYTKSDRNDAPHGVAGEL